MLKRFVLGATLLAVLVAPATAQSPLDWVPPPEAAQWAPGTTENLATVRRLQPGLTGQEFDQAQFQVARDMATLTALVGRVEASIVQRRWGHRLNAMYDSPRGDQTLNNWGINGSRAEDWMRAAGRPLTAMAAINLFILQRERLENEIENRENIPENRGKLRSLA